MRKTNNIAFRLTKILFLIGALVLTGFLISATPINLISPANLTISNGSNNFTTNISGNNGIYNATLNIYNSTSGGLYYNKTNDISTPGTALSFDGVNDYVIKSSAVGLLRSPATISLWVNLDSTSEKGAFVGIGSDVNGFALGVGGSNFDNTGNNLIGLYDGLAWFDTNVNIGTGWHHVVMNLTTSAQGYWIDGVLVSTLSDGFSRQPIVPSAYITLGADYNFRYVDCELDEVMIFNRSLSSAEIARLYNSGNGLYANTSIAPFNDGLVAGYHFDEGSGTKAIDITGKNNGTLINGPTYVKGKVKTPIFSTTISIIKELVDGTYNWFYSFVDWSGDIINSVNYTLIVDTIFPKYTFTSPVNNSYYNYTNILFNVSTSDSPNASIIPNIDNSLVSWWRMDDVDGTKVIDYMGRNNGTALGGASQVTNGKFGKAFSFDGVDDYADLNTNLYDLGIRRNATISFWLYPISGTNVGGVISDFVDSGGGNYKGFNIRYETANNALTFYVYPNNHRITVNNVAVPNEWQYITGVLGGDNMYLYRNGVEIGNTTLGEDIGDSVATMKLSVRGDVVAGNYQKGSIDEVLIFNRSLSVDEILSLYNATAYEHYNNFTTQGNHTFNSYIQDFAGNVNTTGLTTFTIDTTDPNATLINPRNDTYTNETNQTFTANLSDNIGIKNATLSIVNLTDNSTTQKEMNNVSGTWVSPVIGLVEGIYKWFVRVFDWAENSVTVGNNTFTVDTTYPKINFSDSSPVDNYRTAEYFNITTLINETNIANVTINFNFTNYVYDLTNNRSYFTDISDLTQWNFTAQFGKLGPNEKILYNVTVTDKSGQKNWTETRLIGGNLPPSLVNLTQNVTDMGELDPGIWIGINATLLDEQDNFESAWLQVTNNSSDWSNLIYNISMTNFGNLTNIRVNAPFQLPSYVGMIYYRIFANDSVGGEDNLSVYNISNYWDCTWSVSTTSLDAVSGYFEEKELGNITITNTGDSEYDGGCVVKYDFGYDGFSNQYYQSTNPPGTIKGIDFNSRTITLSPNQSTTITAKGTFPSSDILQEHPLISITSNITDSLTSTSTKYVNATMVVAKGVVLYQEIVQPSSSLNIFLTNQTFDWTSYVSNLGADGSYNNSAYNVTFNWTISSQSLINKIVNGTASLNESFYPLLNDGSKQYSNLSFNFTKENLENDPLPINTPISIKIYSYGYKNESNNFSLINVGNNLTLLENSFNVTFLCNKVADGICVSKCKDFDGDWNVLPGCNDPAIGGPSGSGGGGGGGGGGSSSGSFEKSEATFELVRGEKQEFSFDLENKLINPKENIAIKISGNNSQYVSPEPKILKRLAGESKETIRFKIDAPSYFQSGKYLLQIEFSGDIKGNTTTKFTEIKYVTLIILEMPRSEANDYVNKSLEILNKMNESGFYLKDVLGLIDSMNSSYDGLQFNDVKEFYSQIDEIYTSATQYLELKNELNASMIESERNGIEVSETKKLFMLSGILFNRGDYVKAYDKMKEAKSSYLLETKGEFKIFYAIKNNPIEALGILISLSLVGTGSSLLIRMRLLKRKLKILAEEEELLLQLMKVIQRDCFENNKMSMEEYSEAMFQYELRLGKVIQEKVMTETLIANLMRVGGKKKALGQEKDRLIVLLRQTQDDYMNRGKLDTRIYENMLKTYSSRLNDIEEELVFIEAQEQIREATSWFRKKS